MRVGVLGIGKTPHKIQHEKSLRDLAVESGRAAMADAGVDPSDIQALYVGNVGSVGFNYENSTGLMVAHHLGVVPAGSVRVEAACGTGAWALHLGCVAILSGLYDTVMVLGAEKMNDLATVEGTSIIAQAADSKEEYFSGLTFPSGVALTARKYMQTYGLTEEDLAHTSVKNHHYGARNPFAHLRFECTVEEVMRSAKVADPLKLYEVCPMTDASSALVLCREEILRDQPDKPQVYVTATQMATGTWYAATDTLEDAHRLFAEPAGRAYAMAGVIGRRHRRRRDLQLLRHPGAAGHRGPRLRRAGQGLAGRRRRLDLDRRQGGGQPVGWAAVQGPPARGDRRHPGGRHRRAAARHRPGGHAAPRRGDRHLGLPRRPGGGRRDPHLPAAGGLSL